MSKRKLKKRRKARKRGAKSVPQSWADSYLERVLR